MLSDWHLMRIVRFGAGVLVGFQAWQDGSGLRGLLSGLLILQAFTNSGCCGSGGCQVPSEKPVSGMKNEVNYTGIKSGKNDL